jgi:hypothetical protein
MENGRPTAVASRNEMRWRDPKDIPNEEGYSLFVVLRSGGPMRTTRVIKDAGGPRLPRVDIADVECWYPA